MEDEARVYAHWRRAQGMRQGEHFPAFTLSTIDGQSIDTSMFEGKVTHITTWHYGCLPCMAEIPYLNLLKDAYTNDTTVQFFAFFRDSITQTDTGLGFYAPSIARFQDGEQLPPKFMYEVDFNYVHVPNTGAFAEQVGIRGNPQNFIIGPNGTVLYHAIGASEEDNSSHAEELRKQIEAGKCGL